MALLVKMVLGKQHYSNVYWFRKNTMAISFAAMENKEFLGYLQTEPYFSLK
jgi:hypothetical protein